MNRADTPRGKVLGVRPSGPLPIGDVQSGCTDQGIQVSSKRSSSPTACQPDNLRNSALQGDVVRGDVGGHEAAFWRRGAARQSRGGISTAATFAGAGVPGSEIPHPAAILAASASVTSSP